MYELAVLQEFLPIESRWAEDVELHLRMRRRGLRLFFCPEFYAWHYKRPDVGQYWRQISRFARGRAWLGSRDREGVRPLHWLVALLTPCFVIALLVALVVGLVEPLAAGAVIGLAVLLPSAAGGMQRRSVRVGLCMPLVLALFPLAWSHGFLSEWAKLRWRARDRTS